MRGARADDDEGAGNDEGSEAGMRGSSQGRLRNLAGQAETESLVQPRIAVKISQSFQGFLAQDH